MKVEFQELVLCYYVEIQQKKVICAYFKQDTKINMIALKLQIKKWSYVNAKLV